MALAHADGWREAFPTKGEPHTETRRGGILLPYYWVNERTHERRMELPYYLEDLNAMHEIVDAVLVEAGRKGDWRGWDSYVQTLSEMVGIEGAIEATASQRAEALLRVLGKWKE